MNYLIVVLISSILIFSLLFLMLQNYRSSYEFILSDDILTIKHPLKDEVIDLDLELKSWNVQGFRRLWWGKIYSVNLELRSGKWRKIYATQLAGKITILITHLESTYPERVAQSAR